MAAEASLSSVAFESIDRHVVAVLIRPMMHHRSASAQPHHIAKYVGRALSTSFASNSPYSLRFVQGVRGCAVMMPSSGCVEMLVRSRLDGVAQQKSKCRNTAVELIQVPARWW
jgi:hypothetical protein